MRLTVTIYRLPTTGTFSGMKLVGRLLWTASMCSSKLVGHQLEGSFIDCQSCSISPQGQPGQVQVPVCLVNELHVRVGF